MSWFTKKSMSRQELRFAMNEQKKLNEDLRRQKDYQAEIAKGRKIKEEIKKESFKNSGIGKIVSGMKSWSSKVDLSSFDATNKENVKKKKGREDYSGGLI